MKRDVFLCHASADKETYVRPLAALMAANGITYWLDEAEIHWGDRITKKINHGLADSRYVVVFFTQNFLQRNWPQTELGSALNLEASTGEVTVLPIMIADESQIFTKYPLLRDKLFLRWDKGLDSIVRELQRKLSIEFKNNWSFCHPANYSGDVWIQLIPKPENRMVAHSYLIRWGAWEYTNNLDFKGEESACLLHMKGDDSFSLPIFLAITPECYVLFGRGSPPDVSTVNINYNWRRLEGA